MVAAPVLKLAPKTPDPRRGICQGLNHCRANRPSCPRFFSERIGAAAGSCRINAASVGLCSSSGRKPCVLPCTPVEAVRGRSRWFLVYSNSTWMTPKGRGSKSPSRDVEPARERGNGHRAVRKSFGACGAPAATNVAIPRNNRRRQTRSTRAA